MIFMTHPIHGAMHVYPAEVEAHIANGWKPSTYDEWLAPKQVKPESIEQPIKKRASRMKD